MKKLFLMFILAANAHATEYIEYKSFDTRHNRPAEVLAEVHFPKTGSSPYPVIITQHGSSPEVAFKNGQGRTDVFSKTVIEQGTKQGFVVVAIDAFYKRNLDHTKKPEFPNASEYALDLKNIIATDRRFDASKIFYTGWSYGGIMSLNVLDQRHLNDKVQWRAVAPSEAGCQFQPKAAKISFPVLFVLGEASHYPPQPCLYYVSKMRELGVEAEAVVIAKANHHFSTYGMNGRSIGSLSLNGCTDNPVIRDRHQWYFANGEPTTLEQATQRCFTRNGANGKGAEDKLSESVNYIITFFAKQK